MRGVECHGGRREEREERWRREMFARKVKSGAREEVQSEVEIHAPPHAKLKMAWGWIYFNPCYLVVERPIKKFQVGEVVHARDI